MSPPALFDDYSENTLVEQPAIALFASLNWQTANLYHETFGPHTPKAGNPNTKSSCPSA